MTYNLGFKIYHNIPHACTGRCRMETYWAVRKYCAYSEARGRVGKTILHHSWKAHAAEYEHGPEMWWAFQRLYVCGTWSLTRLGKIGCGRGLGNGSVRVSEFCREPLDFIEVYDQNTHEKGNLAKARSQFMLKRCVFSHPYHMLASINVVLFTCHTCCWCFYCNFCVTFDTALESRLQRNSGQNDPEQKAWRPCRCPILTEARNDC